MCCACLIAPVVTTTFFALSSNKIQKGVTLVPDNPGSPGKWPLKLRQTLIFLLTARLHCLQTETAACLAKANKCAALEWMNSYVACLAAVVF